MPLQLYEREDILEACLAEFARHGYKNTSTEMLAEAAGISKALLFHHFGSKKKLYFRLLERCFAKVRFEVRFDFVSEHADFFEAIGQLVHDKLEYFRKHPYESRLVYEAFYSTPDELKQDIEEKYGQVSTERNEVLEKLFEKEPLRDGVDRKSAFELIMIVSKRFETKFATEVADMSAVSDDYAESLLAEMKRYFDMLRNGIAAK
ncbi:TetR family transcriptional regulator [Paenibacillus flagellatus]|uniref:TetR family transcriptional regulator n=1 Tax=Paenibacillus flagellatus TaxID=2211139 RepID=A0A2V5JXQ8_9BACL|nr:TetR family transcriptional regulator [Paenibacillus flagellatus]